MNRILIGIIALLTTCVSYAGNMVRVIIPKQQASSFSLEETNLINDTTFNNPTIVADDGTNFVLTLDQNLPKHSELLDMLKAKGLVKIKAEVDGAGTSCGDTGG